MVGAPGTVGCDAFEGVRAVDKEGGETVGCEGVYGDLEGVILLGERVPLKETSSSSSSEREPREVSKVELSDEEDSKRSIIEVVAVLPAEVVSFAVLVVVAEVEFRLVLLSEPPRTAGGSI